MPSYVDLLEFCARAGVAFHLVGSVGRFAVAVPENRTRRGVWTSGYMRQKYVQYELLQKFFARGLGGSWTDCAYILGTVAGGGANPGFHDSMWKAAAIQRAVGVAFPGDATLVPVDALVEALWVNATAGAVAPYMSLRLKRVLASADIGVATSVCAADFWRAADAAGFPRVAVRAFVPPDIDALVAAMHRPFEAPPAVRAIFDAVDEGAVIAANFAYARREFGALEAWLPRRGPAARHASASYPYGANHNGTVALGRVAATPSAAADVAKLLRADAASGVRCVGSAKSNTACLAAPRGAAILRLDPAPGLVAVAEDRATATVGAGVCLRDVVAALGREGLMLYSAVEIGNLTMGAAAVCHTKNRHAPGDKGILSSYVAGATFVDGRGRVHEVRTGDHAAGGGPGPGDYHRVDGKDAAGPRSPAAVMRHLRSSHGLLGVVVDVVVAVRPAAGRSVDHAVYASAADFADVARDHANSGGSVFAYLSPSLDRYLVETQKPTLKPPKGHWFWAAREVFITALFPVLFRVGDLLPATVARLFYGLLHVAGEAALTRLHAHGSAPPGAHVGWHDHGSWTKFQWTFLAFPLDRAGRLFDELRAFCDAYERSTGYANAYFVSYVMERDAFATFSYAAAGPVVTVDPIAANACGRFLPFCEALAAHLDATVGGLKGAFNQSVGVAPRALGAAVRANAGAGDFLQLRKEYDPEGRFLNAFFEEILAGVASDAPIAAGL